MCSIADIGVHGTRVRLDFVPQFVDCLIRGFVTDRSENLFTNIAKQIGHLSLTMASTFNYPDTHFERAHLTPICGEPTYDTVHKLWN